MFNPLTKAAKFLLAGLKNLRSALTSLSIDEFVVTTLEMLMLMERDEYIQHMKALGTDEKGNGVYPRAFRSLSRNALFIKVPRTRYTSFKPIVLELLKYNQEQVNELVLTLYSKGLSTRDVSQILQNFFGEDMSYSKVSILAEKFHEIRQAWLSMPLESHYKVVFCDAIYVALRRGNSYAKEAVHITYGVREDNKRELLTLSVNPTESASSWAECFEEMKKRQIQKIDLIVADGLKGLENEVHKHFPGTVFQKCVFHKKRQILAKVRPKDKFSVSKDLEAIFSNTDTGVNFAQRKEQITAMIEKWAGMYPHVKRSFENETLEYYFSYLKFPYEVRKMIYTTNSIESLNKQIRKATKNKQSFEKEDRLLDYVFVVIKQFEESNWMKYPISAFGNWTQ